MSETRGSQFVIARILEHVEPIERGERYEDPLTAFLSERGLGRVTGGGSQLTETGEIAFADLEIELVDLDDAVGAVIGKLEELGAPHGSMLEFDVDTERPPIPFGTLEELIVYLDGTGLPEAVYNELDFDALYDQMHEAVQRHAQGMARSVWGGATETAVHFVGPSADALEKVIGSLWDTVPVLQNARLTMRYADGRPPGEKRLPLR